MSRVRRVGIIAEDVSDYDAAVVFISRVAGKSNLGFRKKIGNGSGKIVSKCLAWSNELGDKGCELLILLHDRDRHDLAHLHAQLSVALEGSIIGNRFICIPVEEIEAWFLGDPDAIKKAFRLKKLPKFSGLPEHVASPKEKLHAEILRCSDKTWEYIGTNHNAKLAQHMDFDILIRRCASFKQFHDFIKSQSF